MGINKNYAVFGLGRYGKAVATELTASGAEVIAVDSDSKTVEELVGVLPVCKCADVTEPEVIKQLGISNIDTVIIAIGGQFEASVMATMLCKEAGVKWVIVKCSSDIHKNILEKVGADMVVFPEKDSGTRLAKNLLSSGFVDIVDISEDISIIELDAKSEWVNKTLKELDLRKKYSVNVIALKKGEEIIIAVNPDMIIEENVKLIVIADKLGIGKLKK